MRDFVERFGIEPALSSLTTSMELHASRGRGGDLRSRLTPVVLTPVVFSLVAMAIDLLTSRATRHGRRVVGCDPGGRSTDEPARALLLFLKAASCRKLQRTPRYPAFAAWILATVLLSSTCSAATANRETRLLAAQGELGAGAHDQLALLMMLIDDADPDVAMTALSTVQRLPLDPLRAFLARADVPGEMREFFASMGISRPRSPHRMPPRRSPAMMTTKTTKTRSEETTAPASRESKLLPALPIKKQIKLASKGTREQRAQLIRDPNKLVPRPC